MRNRQLLFVQPKVSVGACDGPSSSLDTVEKLKQRFLILLPGASSTVRGANLRRETSPQPQVRCVETPGQVMALEPGMTREDFLNKVFRQDLVSRGRSACV